MEPVPSPRLLVDTVARLVSSTWPRDEAERVAWFDRHGLTPTRGVGDWSTWGTGLPGWGDTLMMWSHDERGFVGVGWLLWQDDPARLVACDELVALLTDAYGPGTPRGGCCRSEWIHWHSAGVVIEFCRGSQDAPRAELHLVHHELGEDEEGRHGTGTVLCAPETLPGA